VSVVGLTSDVTQEAIGADSGSTGQMVDSVQLSAFQMFVK